MLVWWSTELECVSAFEHRERGARRSRTVDELARFDELRATWEEISPHEALRRMARRLLRVHALRAADALQLAAAIAASDGDPSTLDVVCLDRRIVAAAKREGFHVLPD